MTKIHFTELHHSPFEMVQVALLGRDYHFLIREIKSPQKIKSPGLPWALHGVDFDLGQI